MTALAADVSVGNKWRGERGPRSRTPKLGEEAWGRGASIRGREHQVLGKDSSFSSPNVNCTFFSW